MRPPPHENRRQTWRRGKGKVAEEGREEARGRVSAKETLKGVAFIFGWVRVIVCDNTTVDDKTNCHYDDYIRAKHIFQQRPYHSKLEDFMEHLTMKQAQGEILEYVKKHSYNYALLIDGEWGCGKTYFIKNTVIPEIEKIPIKTPEQEDSATENGEEPKTKEVIYASLYGIKSIDDIAQQIMQILAEKKLNIKGKWLAGLKFSAEIIEKIFSSNEGATNQIAGASIQFVSDWENYVMIFDDLERTHLPINEVFGYINQFVEQNNATVILVANEKEIDSALMQENLEQRYLVCLSDSIKYSNEKKPPFTPEDMNERLEDVFGESDRYKKIKEKLIGRTIYFKPDLEELIKQITKGVKDETARKAIEEMIPQIVKIMRQEDHYNLRTYQFALAFLEKVILSMKKKGINRLEYKLISTLLTAILKVAIAYKNGAKNFEWSFMAEYGSIAKEGRVLFGNSFTSFKFIHDYIYYSGLQLFYRQFAKLLSPAGLYIMI